MKTQQRYSEAMFMFFVLSVILLFIGVNSYGVIQISSIDELQKIGNDAGYPLDGEYELTQNIDASDTINWNSGAGFAPIGNNTNRFTGVFDGKGYKIHNLYINRPGQIYVGLFGYLDSSGQVKNLGLENVQVVGHSSVGGLVGMNEYGTLMQSYSTGLVAGEQYVGGLVGYNTGTVTHSYSMSSMSGGIYVGGLVGINVGTVTQSYSTGSVSGGELVGGLIGLDYGGTITNSYWDKETSGQTTSDGGEGKTTAEMKQQATFVGWDFTTVWDIEENVTYPYLQALGQPVLPPTVVNKEIWNLSDLNKIGRDWEYPIDGRYTLMADIDASDTINWDGGKGFKPITLVGRFDGNGHVIQNLYINRLEEAYIGLFGIVYGEVLNIGVENVQVVGKWNVGGLVGKNRGTVEQSYLTGLVVGNYSAGGLVGWNDGTVTQSYSTGSVVGEEYLSGLVGYNTGTVTQSYSMGLVVGNYSAGGLVGYNDSNGTVTQSYSAGSVSGKQNVGGLVGVNDGGTVTDSYWDINTSGQSTSVGGEGKTTAEMKQQATFVGWDFTTVWDI